MDFGTAIQVCFSKYVDFAGRARRSEYWYFQLFYTVVSFGFAIVDSSGIFGNVWFLACFLPLLAAGVRRMHDIGKSGWFFIIPIYNIVLLATDSTPGPNQYGAPVK